MHAHALASNEGQITPLDGELAHRMRGPRVLAEWLRYDLGMSMPFRDGTVIPLLLHEYATPLDHHSQGRGPSSRAPLQRDPYSAVERSSLLSV